MGGCFLQNSLLFIWAGVTSLIQKTMSVFITVQWASVSTRDMKPLHATHDMCMGASYSSLEHTTPQRVSLWVTQGSVFICPWNRERDGKQPHFHLKSLFFFLPKFPPIGPLFFQIYLNLEISLSKEADMNDGILRILSSNTLEDLGFQFFSLVSTLNADISHKRSNAKKLLSINT